MNTTTNTTTTPGRQYVTVERPLAPRYDSDTGSRWPVPETLHGVVSVLGAIGVEWLSAASRISLMIEEEAHPDALTAFGISPETATKFMNDHRSFLAGARYGLLCGADQLDELCTALLAMLDKADETEAAHYGVAE